MTPGRLTTVIGATLALLVSMACTHQSAPIAKKDSPRAAHAFRGKVDLVDVTARSLTVKGEDVPGWMPAMTMIYNADNAEVFTTIKAGDEITATVYDLDFNTLHDVHVVPSKKTP